MSLILVLAPNIFPTSLKRAGTPCHPPRQIGGRVTCGGNTPRPYAERRSRRCCGSAAGGEPQQRARWEDVGRVASPSALVRPSHHVTTGAVIRFGAGRTRDTAREWCRCSVARDTVATVANPVARQRAARTGTESKAFQASSQRLVTRLNALIPKQAKRATFGALTGVMLVNAPFVNL